ncbi:cholesterol oxidase [Allocatelliglobosispora scoriae]|uniref:Cholesterol oxidase n=1 Tax=Allocatelliglobosispora scoriae TaxID=643052 RepID=A0A841BR75_9ACTN|nr:GMC family oxidoreductase [Allocatelliglobosispora scoriae]MBB5871557.1 cholesterol oxidase [Allocatelliglobosispora scoriae]
MRYDVVVIGSGFGGSVAALRLVEKGYSVAVLEAGRRFADADFAKTSWRTRRFLWAPALGCYGIQRMTLLRADRGAKGAGVLVLSGAGVGGGSLVYANTLYRPPAAFFNDPQWSGITDWAGELDRHYDQAERMLGVVSYDRMTAADGVIKAVAERMGVGRTFRLTPVGVHLQAPAGQTVPDPYFGGAGPERSGCLHCGECMTGCRHNAKNTLVKNYLHLAEQAGAVIHPYTTASTVRSLPGGGYAVEVTRTDARFAKRRRAVGGGVIEADQVIFAAGALGTQRLLHRSREAGHLTGLSARLGVLTRTNSEALLGAAVARGDAKRRNLDFTHGVAITSSFHPDESTHVEPVRYGKGSNVMGLLQTLLVDGGPRRKWRAFKAIVTQPGLTLKAVTVRGWSERTIIALVMQTLDNSLTTVWRRGGLRATRGHGEPNPTWIPVGNETVRQIADEIGGFPGGSLPEVFDVPITAHILGGAVIGASAQDGVVDAYHRVFGQPGLHVVDGAAVCANLGVNPSLTITAQAERAMSFWPNAGADDPRPALGSAYTRIEAVAPINPQVPAGAPAALRWGSQNG